MPDGSFTIVVVASFAALVKVLNPFLDSLIVPTTSELWGFQEEQEVEFDLKQTDVLGYDKLGFVKPEIKELEMEIGYTFFLAQSLPKWIIYLLQKNRKGAASSFDDNKDKYETKTVNFLDARQRSENLSMAKNGFTLLTLPKQSRTQKWRKADDVAHFQQEILPMLRDLFPNATRIEFTNNVVRGGNTLGDQPAAVNGPHLDYSQNDSARVQFHTEYPIQEAIKEHLALLGKWDTEQDEMKILLGIWKPILMKNVVYDHPLAILDASTYHPDQERPHKIHFDMGFFKFHNLNGGIAYHPDQQWYYYPYQTDTEVLVFTQYSKYKHFANPHTSFRNPNRPKDGTYDTRVSIEMRAAVFFPK